MFVAAITPRRAQEYSIDLGATLEMIDFLGESGVAGIALLGSTGEFVHFALDDRRHMVNFAAKRSRVPLLVNVSHSTLDGAVELAREAASAGVAGVLLMPPHYFRHSQDEIRSFYLAFADAIDGMHSRLICTTFPPAPARSRAPPRRSLLASGRVRRNQGFEREPGIFPRAQRTSRGTPFTFLSRPGTHLRPATARRGAGRGVWRSLRAAGVDGGVGSSDRVPATQDALPSVGGAPEGVSVDWAELLPMATAAKEALKQRKFKSGALAMPLGARGRTQAGGICGMVSGLAASAVSCASANGRSQMTNEEFRRYGRQTVDWMADYLENIRDYPVLPAMQPGDLVDRLPAAAPEQGESMDVILEDFEHSIVPALTHWNHPRFFAYFAISGSPPGILGEMLTAALNVNGMVWKSCPAVTELEQVTLSWLRQWMGLPQEFFGIIYDTASIGSMHAIAAAREMADPECGRAATPGRLVMYTSEHSQLLPSRKAA